MAGLRYCPRSKARNSRWVRKGRPGRPESDQHDYAVDGLGCLVGHTTTYPDNPALGFCGRLPLLAVMGVGVLSVVMGSHQFFDENLELDATPWETWSTCRIWWEGVSPLTCIFVVFVLVFFLGVAVVMVIVIVVIVVVIIVVVVLVLLQPFEPVIWGLCAMVAITLAAMAAMAGAAAAAHGGSVSSEECALREAAVIDHYEKGGSEAPNKGWW